MEGVTVHSPDYPQTPLNTPFLCIYTYSTIFGKYQCFISLTFSLGPDEIVIVWWLQKLIWLILIHFTLFLQSADALIM